MLQRAADLAGITVGDRRAFRAGLRAAFRALRAGFRAFLAALRRGAFLAFAFRAGFRAFFLGGRRFAICSLTSSMPDITALAAAFAMSLAAVATFSTASATEAPTRLSPATR